ncbi:hypothetical protein [Nocardia sp. NPDC048505]|uniref:hypothetical protein n=1 Tax=unclassified Nocardia TaxID=2637762 RepID=UPI0033FCDFD5
MSLTTTRLLTATVTAAAALTIALPAAAAAPTTNSEASETCADLTRALNRAERELRITNSDSQQRILEFRIRRLESQLNDNNC